MIWPDAKILIDEIRRLRGRRGRSFLNRLECTMPPILSPDDKRYLLYIYETATEKAIMKNKEESNYADAGY
jgi:hypothetical protein